MRKNSRGKLSGAVRDETLAEVQRQEEDVRLGQHPDRQVLNIRVYAERICDGRRPSGKS